MSREDFVAVLSRIFAVYLFFVAVRFSPSAFAALEQPTPGSLAAICFAVVLLLLATALFWVFPLSVARKLLPVMKEPGSKIALNSSTAWSLAISAVGLWIFATALIDASYWAIYFVRVQQLEYDPQPLRPEDAASIGATVVQLVVGLVLILGSNGLRSVIFRLRYGREG